MKKILPIIFAINCLLRLANAAPSSAPDPDLERTLAKYNQWKASHPNAIVRFKASQDGMSETVTSYYFENKFKIVTEIVADHVNARYVEFLSDNGDVLNYFPLTQLTVKEDSPLKIYVLKEMGWTEELTAAKIEHFGGTIAYLKKDNRDCLILKLPSHPFDRQSLEKPSSYDSSLVFELDETGKTVRQTATFDNSPPVAADLEYITFDEQKVGAEYGDITVKSAVATDTTLEAAFSAELEKSATTGPPSPGRKWFLLLFGGTILIPILIGFRKFLSART